MDKLRSPYVAAIVIGLFAGTSVGVSAQEPERVAPVEVTGTELEGPCPGGSSRMVDFVEQNRDYTCKHSWSMSDPLLDGTFTRLWSLDFYQDGTGLIVGYSAGRLENDVGSWQQRPNLRVGFRAETEGKAEAEMLVFDGEDAYEGLVAVVEVQDGPGTQDDPRMLHGYIIDGEYPPPPEVASTE